MATATDNFFYSKAAGLAKVIICLLLLLSIVKVMSPIEE
jgi:hypothetical protein